MSQVNSVRYPASSGCFILGIAVLLGAEAAFAELPRLGTSENQRFLLTEGGEPFFWLGDTAWELFHRLDRDEAKRYLDDRAAKGFNVIQAVALAELNGLEEPNRYGHRPLIDNDPSRPDVRPGPDNDYWDFVDEVIQMAAERNLYVGFLPTWGVYVTRSVWSGEVNGIFNVENAEAYGRFMGQRYRDATNIIWIIGGDRMPTTPEARAVWRALARGIAIGIHGEEDYTDVLMTYHVAGPGHASDYFHDEPWLTFTSAQSSHGNLVESWRFIEKHWDRLPIKPVIDLESSYPTLLIPAAWLPEHVRPIHRSTQPGDEDDARRAAYWAVFAGAFGHTYGHNSIWQMHTPGRQGALNPRMAWHEALDAPSARQMGYLRKLMESRPMPQRIPDQSMIVGAPGEDENHVRATRDADGGYAFIYIPTGSPVTIRLENLSGEKLNAAWYDPRDGATTSIGLLERKDSRDFRPPSQGRGNDWVLILDDASREFSLPE